MNSDPDSGRAAASPLLLAVSPWLFGLTLFVAAALLFSVQPMVARMVLPVLGGTPAVWTTCLLFFQATVLLGYLYARAVSRMPVRFQFAAQIGLLALALAVQPVAIPQGTAARLATLADPTFGLLWLLLLRVGLPVVVVATTAPLLQSWFATTGHPTASDPYHLYAASNAGSLLALLAYPFWVERHLALGAQAGSWWVGSGVLAALIVGCALMTGALRSSPPGSADPRAVVSAGPGSAGSWWTWAGLAAIPSSLLMGVTTHITTDLAAIPLLWVVPLALYLLSFVAAFGRRGWAPPRLAARVVLGMLAPLTLVLAVGLPQAFWMVLHLAGLFAAALLCHGELARRRPEAGRLGSYYLAISVGGALGGLFDAVVAPNVFNRVVEYPLALLAAGLVAALVLQGRRPVVHRFDLVLSLLVGALAAVLCADPGGVAATSLGALLTTLAAGLTVLATARATRRPVRYVGTLGSLLAASSLATGLNGRPMLQERSFFGVLRVTDVPAERAHRMFHGSTLHGEQSYDADRRREPLTYFTREGPVGDLFRAFRARRGDGGASVAVTGVGVGTLAAYAMPGDAWTFCEIDPAVVKVARDPRYFTYLTDCEASRLDVRLGDARVSLAAAPDHGFDLLVLDAFTSDAIPAHLLTREAIRLYRGKLRPGGLLAFNVTNRYIELGPVVGRLAADAGLDCRLRADVLRRAEEVGGRRGSIWAVMAERPEDLGPLAADPRWTVPTPDPADRVWTDDHSNLFDHLRLFGRTAAPR